MIVTSDSLSIRSEKQDAHTANRQWPMARKIIAACWNRAIISRRSIVLSGDWNQGTGTKDIAH